MAGFTQKSQRRGQSEYGGPSRKRQNRGRQEMRSVTRTARRPARSDEAKKLEREAQVEIHTDSEEEEEVEREDSASRYKKASKLLVAQLLAEYPEEHDEEETNPREPDGQSLKLQENEDDDGEEGEDDDEEDADGIVVVEDDKSDEEEDEEDFLGLDSDDEDAADPFEAHFGSTPTEYLDQCSTVPENKWTLTKTELDTHLCSTWTPPVAAAKKFTKTPEGASLDSYNIKQRVKEAFKEKYGEDSLEGGISQKVFDPMMSYHDIMFPYVDHKNQDEYAKLYAMHAMNHIHKTRDRVLKNTMRLRIQNEKIEKGQIKPEEEREFRDQGFTRPKVLIVLPTRHHCYRVMQHFIALCGVEQVENVKKFKSQFWDDAEVPEKKPEDFRNLFQGNSNDFFCLGAKMTRKSFKLYSSFLQSDIIFASPLGIQLILNNPDKKKRQTDFLSSIELFIMDMAHAIEMQNWENVELILSYLNKVPKDMNDTDFSRVRMWSINDQARYFTQTLVFSEYATPFTNDLIMRSSNIFGKHIFRAFIPWKEAAMRKVPIRFTQIFSRFNSTSFVNDANDRFNYFKSVIIPYLANQVSYEEGMLIYVPEFADFLRIKNYMSQKTSLLFSKAYEYSSQQALTRARALFQQGRVKLMLYSERLHHFKRYELKGVKNVIMFGVPTNPIFYTEFLSSLVTSVYQEIADYNISTVRVIYSKFDALALERIVGTERAIELVKGEKEMYEFK